ncbi:MAG: helix-turn-helix transcriptional regulator [Clostridia bacterium]|jgi:DNA-binding XRE family transcriptional regulator|nr:helix-turn-helix transcriptional regulator [Clostridia bacterium]
MFEKNITQVEMANKLGIGISSLNRKLNGQNVWKLHEAQMISEIFNIPIEDLFYVNKVAKRHCKIKNQRKVI